MSCSKFHHHSIIKRSMHATTVIICIRIYIKCRVYTSFALENILATAFGRRVDIQKGESDEFTKAMTLLSDSVADGQFEQIVLMNSKVECISCLKLHNLPTLIVFQVIFHGWLGS